jgi:hypothetical protein
MPSSNNTGINIIIEHDMHSSIHSLHGTSSNSKKQVTTLKTEQLSSHDAFSLTFTSSATRSAWPSSIIWGHCGATIWSCFPPGMMATFLNIKYH